MNIASHIRQMKFWMLATLLMWLVNIGYAQKTSYPDFAAELLIVENLYSKKEEKKALSKVDKLLNTQRIEKHATPEEFLSMLRWKVRIHYEMRETHKADSVLKYLFSIDDDLDYERFKDKKRHFRLFVQRSFKEYDKGFVFVNKYKEDADLAPAAITVYTRSDLDELGPRNLVDLLRMTPGFSEMGDNNERNFGTRGVHGTTVQHILFLINGHRVNDLLTSSNAPDWFSLDYVEQIEIMRGPGSALYGGNAFSGVINIITKSGKTFEGSQFSLKAGSAQLFDDIANLSDHQYALNYQFGSRLQNRDKLYISGTVKYSGGSKYKYNASDFDYSNPMILPDIRSTDTIPPNISNTEYINRYLPSYNFLANYINKRLDVTFNAQSSVFAIHRPNSGNLWNANDNSSRIRNRKDQRQFVKLNYDLLSSKGLKNDLSLKLSFDHFLKDLYIHQYANFETIPSDTSLVRLKGDEFRGTASLEFNSEKFSIFKRQQMSQVDSTKGISVINKSFTLMGVQTSITDWFYTYFVAPENQNEFRSDPDQNLFQKQNDNENTASFFFQSSQHIINDRLVATAGFRLNYHPIYSDFRQFRWGDEISPRLSIVYLSKTTTADLIPFKLKLLYNSAFLPPAFLYRRGGITGFRAVDNLNSQKIESIELSLFGETSKKFKYNVNHFINKIDQFLLRKGDIYENDANIRRLSGWEFNFEYTTDISSSRLKAKSFLSISTTSLKTTSDQSPSILQTALSTNFSDSSLFYYPKLTIYGGIQGSYRLSGKSQSKLLFGFSLNHHGATEVSRSVDFNETTNTWESGLSEQVKLPSIAPIFNLNLRKVSASGKSMLGVSFYNLFNTRYQLPSVVSRTGQILGEKRTILFTFTYFVNQGNQGI